MRGIGKRFGSVIALQDVDLTVLPGEVHAIAGENGAGKSTLMRILYGLVRADNGAMEIDGKPFAPADARTALARGIGMVHQHFQLFPRLSVTENAVLGDEPTRSGGRLDRSEARRRVAEVSDRFGLGLDPDAIVEDLSVGERQRLEILKVLLRGARLLVLDEPSAVLVPEEARALFSTVRRLASEGATVLFITHKLGEVVEYADRVTVLRRGRRTGSFDTEDVTEAELARLMVGREPAARDAAPRREPGEIVLALKNVTGGRRLRSATLEVRSGEIVGVAGVEGNGQRELVEIVAGLRPFGGAVTLHGRSTRGRGPGEIRRSGIAHVPEDRTTAGIVGGMTVAENLLLGREAEGRFLRAGSFDREAIRRHARERIAAFDIRPPDESALASGLSGGNQQKVVISREAEGEPDVLLAAHPTRGVDVGAREAIHDAILDQRDRGAAVLLVTSDLSEVLRLSDRILVVASGEIVASFVRGEADEETLGRAMLTVGEGAR